MSEGVVTVVRLRDESGHEAASGYAAEHGGAFAYDRIVTQAAFQRRGLGSAVMAALGAARRSRASLPVLVATEAGRALYLRLGWTVLSPWSTAAPIRAAPSEFALERS